MGQVNKNNKNKQTKSQQSVKKNQQEKSAAQKRKQRTEKNKGCGCCFWLMGSLFVLLLIGGALTYDTQVNGKGVFENSATGKALKNAGLLPYVEKAWYTTMGAGARGYKWAEQNVPPYAVPVMQLSRDVFKIVCNGVCNGYAALRECISSKLPIAANFLEQYIPGLPQKIEDTTVTMKSVANNVYDKSISFFRTQVLVGRFSPENLSKTLNDTQNLAMEYVNLFHKKVDAYAKLK